MKKIFLIRILLLLWIALMIFSVGSIFLNTPEKKILRAAYNTCSKSHLLQVITGESAAYTAEIDLSVDGTDLSATLVSSNPERKKDLSFSAGLRGISIAGEALLDEERLAVWIPFLGDKIFTYDYHQENNGYLIGLLEKAGFSQPQWNAMLENAVSGKARKYGVGENQFRRLPFEKAEKKSFLIDGKEQLCTGYRTTVAPEQMQVFLKKMELDKFLQSLGQQGSLYVTFYINKKQLVEVAVEKEESAVMTLHFPKDAMLSADLSAFPLGEKTATGTVRLTEGADTGVLTREFTGEEIDVGNASWQELLRFLW